LDGHDEKIYIVTFNGEVWDRCKSKCLEAAALVMQQVVAVTMTLKGIRYVAIDSIKGKPTPDRPDFKAPDDIRVADVKSSCN
jgi:hypothetical protein